MPYFENGFMPHPASDLITTRCRRLSSLILLAVILVASAATVNAQSRVYEKDLRGEWKLMTELKEKADNPLERIILNAVDGIVEGVDVRFVFHDNHDVTVTVVGLEDDEPDQARWWINDDGQLVISESDQVAEDGVWMLKGGRLYAYDLVDGKPAEVTEGAYLERVK